MPLICRIYSRRRGHLPYFTSSDLEERKKKFEWCTEKMEKKNASNQIVNLVEPWCLLRFLVLRRSLTE
jgi:hypothetical protein